MAENAVVFMIEPLLDTWRIHARIQLYVLDAIDEAALAPEGKAKGRSTGEQFAHIHQVRMMWLKSAAPELLEGLEKVEKEQAGDKALLRRSLEASGAAMERMLREGLETGRVKGFKPHPYAFLGYIIAHESYHQGDIGTRLEVAGHPLDKKTAYGMWEWGSR
jgi:uncharacterized damage-inducible protein DinB